MVVFAKYQTYQKIQGEEVKGLCVFMILIPMKHQRSILDHGILYGFQKNGIAPKGKQYSHRCHQENCVNPIHGVWEDDYYNKDRNGCKSGSHIIMPDESIIQICPHYPCCLTPVYIKSWDDDKFIKKGSDITKLSNNDIK